MKNQRPSTYGLKKGLISNSLKLISLFVVPFMLSTWVQAKELVIYSTRDSSYIKPLMDQYSEDTGVPVLYVVGSHNALMKRLQLEGERSTADIYLTAGAVNLWQAANKGLLTRVESRTLENNVPEQFRALDNSWFALSKRPRTIIYNTKTVSEKDLSTYADLALPKWQGKLCLRTPRDSYSVSMFALMAQREGSEQTSTILNGWYNNLGYQPVADDMDILKAIHQGACDVGIINTYYLARFNREQPEHSLAFFWPDQQGEGVYLDITGAGILKHGKNKPQAIDFLEWLSEKRQQSTYAKLSREYPVHPKVYPVREVAKWGKFEEDKQPVVNAGKRFQDALAIVGQLELPQ